ncbi:MAG: PCP reductase family protein [Gammaproteobacteria bacterium]
MDHLAAKMTGPLKMFIDRFGDFVREDDYQQFFSNRRQNGRDTYLSSDFRRAEKLASIILEEYGIRQKLQGNVILTVPDPAWDVPFYMFQLGGNGRQTIALLDIAPTHPDIDYSPLIPVWEKYRKALDIGENKIEWVLTTASPYLLHCQYGEIDTALFNEAAAAYLDVWIEHYYKPARKLETQSEIDIVTNAIYKYKHVLHANDPAYGIFEKSWGKPVADAFHYVESQEHPTLPLSHETDPYAPVWENKELNVMWTLAAQERFEKEPAQSRNGLRATMEKRARDARFGMITPEIYDRLRG